MTPTLRTVASWSHLLRSWRGARPATVTALSNYQSHGYEVSVAANGFARSWGGRGFLYRRSAVFCYYSTSQW